MIKDKASPNWAFMSTFEVWHDGQLYLRRWRLFECPWFGIYLHKICRPDRDRALHDHPWPFVSYVIKGSYEEEVPCQWFTGAVVPGKYLESKRTKDFLLGKREIRWFNFKRAKDAHRISEIISNQFPKSLSSNLPIWTLVLRGKRQRVWGFYTEKGWVPWNEYLGVDNVST